MWRSDGHNDHEMKKTRADDMEMIINQWQDTTAKISDLFRIVQTPT